MFVSTMQESQEYLNTSTDAVLQYLGRNLQGIDALKENLDRNANDLDEHISQYEQTNQQVVVKTAGILDISEQVKNSAETGRRLIPALNQIIRSQIDAEQSLDSIQTREQQIHHEVLEIREDMEKNTELLNTMEQ